LGFPAFAQKYLPTHFGVKEGLNSEMVYKTVINDKGEIYISTQRGIALFDGYRFIKNDSIQTSTIGLYTKNNEIYFFDSNSLKKTKNILAPFEILKDTKKTDDSPNNDHFENIFIDSENRIWCTDFEYLKYINPQTKKVHSFPFYPGKKNLYIHLTILEIRKGEIWLFAPNGLWVWKSSTQQLNLHPNAQIHQLKFSSAYARKNGKILISTLDGGIFQFDKQNNHFEELASLPHQETVLQFAEFEDKIYYLTSNSLYEKRKNEWEIIHDSEQPNFQHLSLDSSTGILWISTSKGLIKLMPIHPSIQNISFGKTDSPVISLTQDANNTIWALTNNSEIWKIQNGKAVKENFTPEGKAFTIQFSQNELFLSTTQGIYQCKNSQFQKLPISIDSHHDIIKTLITPHQELWVVYSTKEIDRFTWPNLQRIPQKIQNESNFWTDNKWQDIQIDQFQRIWLVGWMPKSFGITYYDPVKEAFFDIAKDKKLNPNNGIFVGDYFTKIGQGPNGNMLFTAYGGFNIADSNGKLSQRIDIHKYSILDSHLRGISSDEKGNIFFATGEGLHIYRTDMDKVFRLSKVDGLPNDYLLYSFLQNGFERIYVGYEGGITKIDLEKTLKTQLQNKLEISQILVNGKPRFFEDYFLELNKDERDIVIQFSDYSYLGEGKVHFRYRFSDETKWHVLDNPELVLNHFQPGKYTLEIEAFDNLGNRQGHKLKLEILAHPPFLKSNLFYVLIFCLLMGIIFGVNRYLWKKQNEKQAYLRKIKEAEMKTLRSQMNPHFLFNTLNSINSYIIQHKTEDASSYLTTFSKLMRSILDNSKHEQITLKNELHTLKLYLKLESVRLEHSFDYVFHVDESVSSEFIMVPPLILQPFAENAIWHGLRNLKSIGLLEILVEQPKEETLILKVKDNGIGREASQNLKKNETQHKSYGIDITVDRIKSLNPENSVEIVDLYENGKPAGTVVNITLKLKEND
jgi:ligand-binding sensor domain-containing protein